jgi:ribonuclease HI
VKKKRSVADPAIETSSPYGYFDGAATKSPNKCGAGSIHYISDSHQIKFEGVEPTTLQTPEIKAVSIFRAIALEGVRDINIYGNSMLVVEWLTGSIDMPCSILGVFQANMVQNRALMCSPTQCSQHDILETKYICQALKISIKGLRRFSYLSLCFPSMQLTRSTMF